MRRPPLSITIVLLTTALLSTACRSSGLRSIRLEPPQPVTGPALLDAASLDPIDLQDVAPQTVDDEGWRVIDVIVDNGISELKVRRSEYNLILKQSGVPGLITLLHNKADELVAE